MKNFKTRLIAVVSALTLAACGAGSMASVSAANVQVDEIIATENTAANIAQLTAKRYVINLNTPKIIYNTRTNYYVRTGRIVLHRTGRNAGHVEFLYQEYRNNKKTGRLVPYCRVPKSPVWRIVK